MPRIRISQLIRDTFHEMWDLERFQNSMWPPRSLKDIGIIAIRYKPYIISSRSSIVAISLSCIVFQDIVAYLLKTPEINWRHDVFMRVGTVCYRSYVDLFGMLWRLIALYFILTMFHYPSVYLWTYANRHVLRSDDIADVHLKQMSCS